MRRLWILLLLCGAAGAQSDWPMPGGNPARNRVCDDLPDELPAKPLWRHGLWERDARLVAIHGEWMVAMHDREQVRMEGETTLPVAYPANRPVVFGGIVFYRDGVEFVARRLPSGVFRGLRVRYGIHTDGQRDTSHRLPVADVRKGPEDRLRFGEYGRGSISCHGGMCFTVEASLVASKPLTGPNLLASYHLRTGKTRWGWRDDLAHREMDVDRAARRKWSTDLKAHPKPQFLGPGVVADGKLITLAVEESRVALWCLDAKLGTCLSRTDLDEWPRYRSGRRPSGARVAYDSGRVFAVTGTGLIAGIDLDKPDKPLWRVRYELDDSPFVYQDPIATSRQVIVAPPVGAELLSLDPASGRIQWRYRPKEGPVQVLGPSSGVVVVAGARARGLVAWGGKVMWGPVRLGGKPFGRGFVSENHAYLPRMDEKGATIERIRLSDGLHRPPLRFDVQRLGNLLSLDGRLIVANEDEIMCFTTLEAELGRLGALMKKHGSTPELLFERALLRSTIEPRQRVEAHQDFRRALALGFDTKIASRALENLLELAVEKSDRDALKEARGIIASQPGRPPKLGFRPYSEQADFVEVQILARLGKTEEARRLLDEFAAKHAGAQIVLDKPAGGKRVVPVSVAVQELRKRLAKRN